MQKQSPIIFSTPMIPPILSGTKTETRRIINPQPIIDEQSRSVFDGRHKMCFDIHNWKEQFIDQFCNYGNIEDLLYVRESWKLIGCDMENGEATFEYADGFNFTKEFNDKDDKGTEFVTREITKLETKGIIEWNKKSFDNEYASFKLTGKHHAFSPSIHLPKWGSRIWLKILSIHVEHLHDITEPGAIAEGIQKHDGRYKTNFRQPNSKSYLDGYTFTAKDAYQELWQSLHGAESWQANPWVYVIKFKVVNAPLN